MCGSVVTTRIHLLGMRVTTRRTRVPSSALIGGNRDDARHDVGMTEHKPSISIKRSLLITAMMSAAAPIAAPLATPVAAQAVAPATRAAAPATAIAATTSARPAAAINGRKCTNPGAFRRANNSRFVCSPEGGRNVWRRINGAANISAVVDALPRFSILTAALKQAGLDGALAGTGPFTLFAPRDAAFMALPKATLDYLLNPANVAVLRRVLLHHVVNGAVRSTDLSTGTYTTLDGTTISAVVRKMNITIDGARVTLGDVVATNGVVHGVSRVLVPADVVITP